MCLGFWPWNFQGVAHNFAEFPGAKACFQKSKNSRGRISEKYIHHPTCLEFFWNIPMDKWVSSKKSNYYFISMAIGIIREKKFPNRGDEGWGRVSHRCWDRAWRAVPLPPAPIEGALENVMAGGLSQYMEGAWGGGCLKICRKIHVKEFIC